MQIDWRTNIQIWLVKIQENDIKVGVVSLLKALSIYIVHTLFLFSLWMFQLNILMPAGRHPTPQIDGQPSDFLETLHIHPERRSGSSFITLHLAPPWSWRPSISTTTLLKFMWLTRWSTLKPANFEAREGSAHELLFLVGFILLLVFIKPVPLPHVWRGCSITSSPNQVYSVDRGSHSAMILWSSLHPSCCQTKPLVGTSLNLPYELSMTTRMPANHLHLQDKEAWGLHPADYLLEQELSIAQLWMSCWLRRANLRWRLVGLACLEMLLCKTTTTLSQDSRMKLDYDMRREVEK